MKKYELTKETLTYFGKTLYRIKALKDFSNVKKGDLGGFVESEDNLSQTGNAWVFGDAKVYGDAKVSGNAWVHENAKVYENAWVYGDAQVYGNAQVYGDAKVSYKVHTMSLERDSLTFLHDRLIIGCEAHSYENWMINYKEIGIKHNYSLEQIELYGDIIKAYAKRLNKIP